MSSAKIKKIICVLMSVVLVCLMSSCSASEGEEETTTAPYNDADVSAEPVVQTTEVVTTEAPTTQAPTTVPETTTAVPGASIQHIIDTLEGKKFYLAGKMDMQSGESIDAKMTCDGEDYRMEMDSSQMKISMLYLDGNPYIVNRSTNSYILFTEESVDSLDKVFNSFSSYGISFSSADISEMKGMMSDFDQNMDFSAYIENGEVSEFITKVDEVEHMCTRYTTEYGSVFIYTLGETLKYIDVYDAEGLRQMRMSVSAFIPQVLTPISLNGLTQSPSILHLFGLAQ